jgi:hypothetical protein
MLLSPFYNLKSRSYWRLVIIDYKHIAATCHSNSCWLWTIGKSLEANSAFGQWIVSSELEEAYKQGHLESNVTMDEGGIRQK